MNIEMDEYIMYVLFFIMGLFTNNLINRICNLQLIEGLDGNASDSASDSDEGFGLYGGTLGKIIGFGFFAVFVIIGIIKVVERLRKAPRLKTQVQLDTRKKLNDYDECVDNRDMLWMTHNGEERPDFYKKFCEKIFNWKDNIYDQGDKS